MSRKQPVRVELTIVKSTFCAGLLAIMSLGGLPALAVDGEEDAKVLRVTPLSQPGPLELRALDYVRFREDIAEVEAMAFDNAKITRNAHMRLSAHDSWALSSGWMAYAALIAADTPAFAQALKAELRGENDIEPTGKKKRKKKKKSKKKPSELSGADLAAARAAFLAKLSADPRYPRKLAGAHEAIAAVMAMARNDNLRVTALGENFKSQAYAMQKTRWGKKRLAASSARLSEAETFRNTRPGLAVPHFEHITVGGVHQPGIVTSTAVSWTLDWGHDSSSSFAAAAGSDAIIDRVLNLAARYAVGAINDRVVSAYAKNRKSEQCLSLVKLTLNQCIAATRTPYEEAFCLGEHALNDVGACVTWVAAN